MDLRSAPGLTYYFWAGIALILIFTVLEPVGTENARIIERFFIWTLQIGIILTLLIGLHIRLQSFRLFNNLNPWVKLTGSGLIGSLVYAPLGFYMDTMFGLEDVSATQTSGEWVSLIAGEASGIIFPVTLTWIAINAPRILRINFKEEPTAAQILEKDVEIHKARGSKPDFFSLIPEKGIAEIIFLKSELHYVRVVTSVGEELVLFNMKDAISDLESVTEGIQTHRSYWVSAQTIQSLCVDKGHTYILTRKDHKIPVSRRRSSAVKAFVRQQLSKRKA